MRVEIRMQRQKNKFIISLLFILSVAVHDLCAQSLSVSELVVQGDGFRNEYRFDDAIEAYFKAMEMETDSLRRSQIGEKMLMAENGKSMTGFVYSPMVVSRHRFSAKDFFLYYPLRDSSSTFARHPASNHRKEGNTRCIAAADWRFILGFHSHRSHRRHRAG